jgi:molybdopterin molybdotransferase
VSVGDLDLVKDALTAAGVERVFWQVAQKPGRPLAFGRAGARLVFGLPGNPVSALVCFWLYVRPALRRMQDDRRAHLPVVQATLTRAVRKATGLTEFVRVRLEDSEEGRSATPMPSQSSGVLSALGAGAGLLVGPRDVDALPAGATFPVIVPGSAALGGEAPPF